MKNLKQYIIIFLFLIIIVLQLRMVKVILDNYELMEAEPLKYAAEKYNLNNCICLEGNREVLFNKTSSTTTYHRYKTDLEKEKEEGFNITELKNWFDGTS